MKALLSIVIILALFGTPLAEAKDKETIDALLILDSQKDIQLSTENNGALLIKCLRQIAKTTGMRLKTTLLHKKEATAHSLRQWFMRAQKRPHNVLFVYFSGHGLKHKTKKPWPYFYLSASHQLVDMNQIIALVEAMPSRLSFVLSDCCNSNRIEKAPTLMSKSPLALDKRKFSSAMKTLFVKAKGHIRATAATPGQVAIGTKKGGMFTISLVMSLLTASQEPHPTWNKVLHNTSSTCRAMNERFFHMVQVPYVDVRVR